MLNLVYLPFGKGGGKVGKVRISNLPKDNYILENGVQILGKYTCIYLIFTCFDQWPP